MEKRRVVLCMGTRPEIIKMAPVYHALRGGPLEPVVLHTGQHEEMAWPLYDFFKMQPDHRLHLQRERPSLGHLSALLMDQLDGFFAGQEAAAVLVHGDTSSALMAALAAFYHKLPVGHVEAGLRSFRDYDPFPEEKNRQLIDRIANWHFAPTEGAVENLRREGITDPSIFQVGNTVVDATRWGMEHAIEYYASLSPDALDQVHEMVKQVQDGRLLVVTAHRRENWGKAIEGIAEEVRSLLESHSDLHLIWPVHLNPIVRKTVKNVMGKLAPNVEARMMLTGPLDYPQMLWLLRHAWLVLTDSGGLQEEAASLNVPVLVLRKTTERPELIEAGGGALIGTEPGTLRAWVMRLLRSEALHDRMTDIENPYGDGHSGHYIADILKNALVVEPSGTLVHAA